ncbi:MAG TPA: PKD domain-containing protein, partial [Flavobacteriales bacterium]|nr:PKD domain-containing protein [Flavobacteriales bacterium]
VLDLIGELGANVTPGGTWTDPNSAVSDGTFTPGVSPNGFYTYTVTGTSPCGNSTAFVHVTNFQATDPGIGQPLNLCSSGPITSLNSSLGGTPDAGGTWTTPGGIVTATNLDPATAASGNYTYTVGANGPCPASSTSVSVTISPAADAGSNGVHALCSDAADYLLINALGGTPDNNGTWTAPDATAHSGTFDPLNDAPGIYTYTVTASAPCTNASSTVTMSIAQAVDAGIGGTASLCANDAAVDPFAWLTGTPDATGVWTAPDASTLATIDPATASSGAYTYTVNGTAPCPDAQAVMNVTIDTPPNAGGDNSIDPCADADAVDLFALLGGADSNGTWTGPGGAASANFQPGVNAPGDYTYTVNGIGACSNDVATATIHVTVYDLPVASFTLQPAYGCAPLDVHFVNTSTHVHQTGVWTFGDGTSTSAPDSASHIYANAGSFSVTLEVTDEHGCANDFTQNNAVVVSAGPDAMFYALPLRVTESHPDTYVHQVPLTGIQYTWSIDSLMVDTIAPFGW